MYICLSKCVWLLDLLYDCVEEDPGVEKTQLGNEGISMWSGNRGKAI